MMSYELHTFVTKLLPSSRAAGLTEMTVAQASVLFELTATGLTACDPREAMPSAVAQSPSTRRLTAPLAGIRHNTHEA
jgi:hypothetical protein